MWKDKKGIGLFLFFLIAGALLGEGAAAIMKGLFPSGQIQTMLTNTMNIGIYPPLNLDLLFFTATLGFQIKLNFFLLVGMLLGVYIYMHA